MNELHVFATALEIASPAQRKRYLDVACGNNQALRRRIDDLLRSYEEAGNFMQAPFVAATVEASAPEQPDAHVGSAEQQASAGRQKAEDDRGGDLGRRNE